MEFFNFCGDGGKGSQCASVLCWRTSMFQWNYWATFNVVIVYRWGSVIQGNLPDEHIPYLSGRKTFRSIFTFLWCLDSIPGHGLSLGGFAFTLTGHITLGRTRLGEWSARRTETSTWQHTRRARGRHPCLRRHSNPQSPQAVVSIKCTDKWNTCFTFKFTVVMNGNT